MSRDKDLQWCNQSWQSLEEGGNFSRQMCGDMECLFNAVTILYRVLLEQRNQSWQSLEEGCRRVRLGVCVPPYKICPSPHVYSIPKSCSMNVLHPVSWQADTDHYTHSYTFLFRQVRNKGQSQNMKQTCALRVEGVGWDVGRQLEKRYLMLGGSFRSMQHSLTTNDNKHMRRGARYVK